MDTNLNKVLKQRYEIRERISLGGMSSVYLGYDLVEKKYVVLKIMNKNIFNDQKTKSVFVNEIKITSQLKHTNIVRIYDYFLFDGYWCLVFEYVEGINLRKVLQNKYSLSEKAVINIVLQILEALTLTQKYKIVHRDIKPENILLVNEKKVKILDFGVSVDKYFANDIFKTKIIGSLKYISPEVVANQEVTSRSDLYSLGIMMFEMLTGKPPFINSDSLALIRKHLYAPMPRVTVYQPEVSQQIENIIIRATAKNVEDRYQTPQAMIADLEKSFETSNRNVSPFFLARTSYQGSIQNPLFLKNLDGNENFFWLRKKLLFGIILLQLSMFIAVLFKMLFENWS